jgi:hypothetical protein
MASIDARKRAAHFTRAHARTVKDWQIVYVKT